MLVGAVEVTSDVAVLVKVFVTVIVGEAVEEIVPVTVEVTVVGTVAVESEVLVVVTGMVVSVVEPIVAVLVTGIVPVVVDSVVSVVVTGTVVVEVKVSVEVTWKVSVVVVVAVTVTEIVVVGPATAGATLAALENTPGNEAALIARASTKIIAIDPRRNLFLRLNCRTADLQLRLAKREPVPNTLELTTSPTAINAAIMPGRDGATPAEFDAVLSLPCTPSGDQWP